jgi:hypothetical protein
MKKLLLVFLLSPVSSFCLNSPTGTSTEVMLSYGLIIATCLLILGISNSIKWIKIKIKNRIKAPHEMPQLPE